MKKTFVQKLFFVLVAICGIACFKPNSAFSLSATEVVESSFDSALSDGLNAYKDGDYVSAVFLLRKALSDPSFQSDEAWYMLIISEMNAADYKSVYADTEKFLRTYPKSRYVPLVQYQQGRALFYSDEYDKAVLVLSDFCHQYPQSELYASAIFWIAESFYAGYNFKEAATLYRRILTEFPTDAKATYARYRLDSITARDREEKLLYLLREAGEEYLYAKEGYEKKIRQYELERTGDVNQQITNLRSENSALEEALNAEKSHTADLEANLIEQKRITEEEKAKAKVESYIEDLRRLKKAAKEAEEYLDNGGK